MTDTIDIQQSLWNALDESPFVMIRRQGDDSHAEPMTAQFDRDYCNALFFYTKRGNRIAPGGKAMAQFAAKGHGLFACLSGTLTPVTDDAIVDRFWSNAVEAWYDRGRADPDLVMLRFDLDDAEIWEADTSVKGMFKLITGTRIKPGELGGHAEVAM